MNSNAFCSLYSQLEILYLETQHKHVVVKMSAIVHCWHLRPVMNASVLSADGIIQCQDDCRNRLTVSQHINDFQVFMSIFMLCSCRTFKTDCSVLPYLAIIIVSIHRENARSGSWWNEMQYSYSDTKQASNLTYLDLLLQKVAECSSKPFLLSNQQHHITEGYTHALW